MYLDKAQNMDNISGFLMFKKVNKENYQDGGSRKKVSALCQVSYSSKAARKQSILTCALQIGTEEAEKEDQL